MKRMKMMMMMVVVMRRARCRAVLVKKKTKEGTHKAFLRCGIRRFRGNVGFG